MPPRPKGRTSRNGRHPPIPVLSARLLEQWGADCVPFSSTPHLRTSIDRNVLFSPHPNLRDVVVVKTHPSSTVQSFELKSWFSRRALHLYVPATTARDWSPRSDWHVRHARAGRRSAEFNPPRPRHHHHRPREWEAAEQRPRMAKAVLVMASYICLLS